MNDTRSMRLTLVDAVIPGTGVLRDVVLIACFAGVTAICSQISFWIGPVPVTGQTFAVLLSGAVLGSKRGALSQISYLAIGATGLPCWFALGGPLGVARLIGPTAGYLFGFIGVAFVVGWLSERGWGGKVYRSVAAMLAGELVLFACGLAWLTHFVSADKLLAVGLYPFVIGDMIKLLLAASLLPAGWAAVNKTRSERQA